MMRPIYLQPRHEINTLRRQFDRMFNDIVQHGFDSSQPVQHNRVDWIPAIELRNTENAIVLRAEVPGVEAKDLDVQVSRTAVSIAGEYRLNQESRDRGRFRSEFRYGKFHRIVQLPVPVQNAEVNADLKDGILTLTLPKWEAQRPKVVKVSLSEVPAATSNDVTEAQAPTSSDVAEAPASISDSNVASSNTTEAGATNTGVAIATADPELTEDVWFAQTF